MPRPRGTFGGGATSQARLEEARSETEGEEVKPAPDEQTERRAEENGPPTARQWMLIVAVCAIPGVLMMLVVIALAVYFAFFQ